MGVLDTFYILFKTNADEAADDVKDLDKATDKAEKSLRNTDATAQRLSTSFVNMAKAAAAPLLALASFGSLSAIAMERAAAVRELDTFSAKLNSSISDVDAFQRSVKELGGETAAALDSLVKIGEKVNEAFADAESGARKDFQAWGLAFKDVEGNALGATDAMIALAANLEKVSQAEALARIKKLGIEDATTIDLLLRGRAAVEEYMQSQKDMGVVTEEQARITREYYGELGKTKNMLTSVGDGILTSFLPAVTRMVSVFRTALGWLMEHRRLVEGFFIGVGAAITIYFLPALYAAAAAVVAATWPFLAIGAAIAAVGAAFALAYEDVRAFMDGQPSLIGELVARYEWLGEAVEAIGTAWTNAKAFVAAAIETLIELAQRVVAAYVDIYGPIFEAWSNLFSAIGELAQAIVDRIRREIGALVDYWAQKFADAKAYVLEAFTGMVGPLDDFTADVQAAADLIAEIFRVMGGILKDIWKGVINSMASGINWVVEKIRGITSMLGGGVEVPIRLSGDVPRDYKPMGPGLVRNAQEALDRAGGSPMGATTSGAIAAGGATVNQSSTVTTGDINIQTQATDAKAIAREVKGALNSELRGTAAQFDDGVDR